MTSSEINPLQRERRSRILVVAPDDAVQNLESLASRIELVPNLFAAIGLIARSSAREPIEALVIDRRAMRQPCETVVEAVRMVDPSVLLYLVEHGNFDPSHDEPIVAGFDDVLSGPLCTATLTPFLRNGDQTAETHTPEGATRANRDPSQEESVRTDPEPHLEEQEPMNTERAITTNRTPSPTHDVEGLIGDSDLVAVILSDPEAFPELALRLIVQETGWHDLSFVVPSDDSDLKALPGTMVEYEGEILGSLVTTHAPDEVIRSWAEWFSMWLALAQSHAQLKLDTHIDSLTGAWNRRYLDHFLPHTLEQAKRERRSISLLVFDVDDLKRYNDNYGHDAGDEVLCETVRLIRSMIRNGDRICRCGGDEFVVVFADLAPPRKAGSMPVESIEALVRRFQNGICHLKFPRLGPDAAGPLTISAGMATYPWDGHDAATLLRVADGLARESKRRGKNALTIGPGSREPGSCDTQIPENR